MNKLRLVSSKYHPHFDTPLQWLDYIESKRGAEQIEHVRLAINLYDNKEDPLLIKGVSLADILLGLGLDNETLAAAIVFPAVESHELHIDTVTETLGEIVSKLLRDFMHMRSIGKIQQRDKRGQQHLENLRKMLLAMVTDIRAVFIVLAARLHRLREAKNLEAAEKIALAEETMAVHAPLANRLGIWQLKWETEDLCLRYLEPETYTTIAKELTMRRVEREAFINRMHELLTNALTHGGIKRFEVTGRVKHIYSIYKKMQRKSAAFKQIYDVSALRVLVQSVEDCYSVLGILQSNWEHVPDEFDDYISKPKPNGYQSIHTVIHGPENHFVEIQIRTYKMHEESELGVAAHWRYKEGVLQPSSYEDKIALLRQIMAWQQEVSAGQDSDKSAADLFADRIYVFTPLGDIVDLPQGATPLDFAYHIHSEVGHRCRGAKVNGHIVQLTHHLQTGDRIEVLTAKQAHPSRDWINPSYGYLVTPRARSKVLHWFRLNDPAYQPDVHEKPKPRAPKSKTIDAQSDKPVQLPPMQILGMNDLLTSIAKCCKPKQGEPVIGYITRGRGVTVHSTRCKNLQYITRGKNDRLIEVKWPDKP